MINKVWLWGMLVFLMGCTTEPSADYRALPAISEEGFFLNAVIEIPAGTNHEVHYDYGANAFVQDSVNDRPAVINFLPYPGNYGFIPNTFMDPDRGGNGGAMEILVLSETVPTGTVMQVMPLGAMQFLEGGRKTYKIIAVPALSSQRSLRATNRSEMSAELTYLIELWFMNYKGTGHLDFLGWKDEEAALELVREWTLPQ